MQSQFDVFGSDFEAFVLIFPNDRRVVFEEEWKDFRADISEKFLGLFGGVLEGFVVVPGFFSLGVIPMGHGMDGAIFVSPGLHGQLEFGGEFLKGHGGVAAMLADEASLQNVAGEEGEERRTAAR